MVKRSGGVYVAEITKRYKNKVYTSHLLRRSYREDGKVKQQTLGNLSSLPPEVIALLRHALRGDQFVPADQAAEIVKTRLHGHVAAVGAMCRRLGLEALLDPSPSAERDLVLAMVIARVVEPYPKLSTTAWWQNTTLVEDPNVAAADEDQLYAAMDWLALRQTRIQQRLAHRHLQEGGLVLYDLTSSYVEGSHCPLAQHGHNRDGKRGKAQINYGLLLEPDGRPVAVQVFPGNTADPQTVPAQVQKLKDDFHLRHIVLVGDRGMLTSARIRDIRAQGDFDWISALRSKDIQALATSGAVSRSLFDDQDLVEISSPDFPGERLVLCRNPLLAHERDRTRRALLDATQQRLDQLARRVAAGRLKDPAKIGAALQRALSRHKVGKHFRCDIAPGRFAYHRDEARISAEAALDGLYVVRTSLPATSLSAERVVLSYKSLAHAEQAFRTLKSIDLRVRPIHHHLERRVRAHIFLCMLAYYVQWHLRQAWAPYLFEDEFPGRHELDNPVRPALRSPQALDKARTKQTPAGDPVRSFPALLASLATVARNELRVPAHPELAHFHLITVPDRLQTELFRLVGLEVSAARRQKTAG